MLARFRTAGSRKACLIGGAAAAITVLVPLAALAEAPSMLKPNWDDPEVKSALESRAATRSLNPEAEGPRDKIKLPVLELSQPPTEGTRSLAPEATAEPQFIYDEDNPVWYQVTETYGDVTVTIEADLRVQQTLPADTVIEEGPTRGLAPGEPEVTIYDAADEGSPGYVATYTVEKFGIPYTVRVECTKETKEQCADAAAIAESRAFLKVTGGNNAGGAP